MDSNNTNNVINSIPEEYRPISMWGYFGYQLLFAIPCVGFIFLLVFALGGTKNYNLRNFARSYFCVLLISVILVLILAMTGVAAGLFAEMMY
ncbi:MAG: ABC transporter permease [Lachnospiraceae bacterium]|nr:ABC transporter permease [Lachnospiraceae bacterium]